MKIEKEKLHDIFYLKCHGYNNTDVSKKTEIHRVTLQRLLAELRNKEDSEFGKIFVQFATETQRKSVANKIKQFVVEHSTCGSYHEIDGKPATCLDMVLKKISKEFDMGDPND